MRLLFPVAIGISSVASAQPAAAPVSSGVMQNPLLPSDCPEADRYLANRVDAWRGKPLQPRKLTELPPADSFAAVLRRDERGCMVLVKYRDVRP